jgi:hypothetical protein
MAPLSDGAPRATKQGMDVWALAKLVAVITTAPLLPRAAKPVLPRLPPLPPPAIVATVADEDPCAAPYSYDVSGIKHYVLACLEHDRLSGAEAVADCTIPYWIDARGYHRYVDACLDAGDKCSVPFSFSSDGIKRFTVECL